VKLLGIDAGKSGSVALLDTDSKRTFIEDTVIEDDGSLDCRWFSDRLLEWEPVAAIIEAVYKPNSLVEMKGEFKGVCKTLNIPIRSVAIVSWKTLVIGQNTSDKKRSIECAQRLYPQADLIRLSPKQQKPVLNADRAEALLLAHYMQQLLCPTTNGS